MQRLPKNLPIDQLQTKWAAVIDPLLRSPIANGILLNDVALANGTTVVNHKLGRKLQGYIIVGVSGAATIYDNQATNQMPELTLSLTSNAAVTAQIWVF